MSKLKRKHFPKPPTQYPTLETMLDVWEILGWGLRRRGDVWDLITPDGYGYMIMLQEHRPIHHEAWDTFLDVAPYYEKTSLVT